MWEWWNSRWNSLESVAWALGWLNILVIVIPILAAIIAGLTGYLRFVVDNRHKYLETQRQQKLADPWRLSAEQREKFVAILSEAPSQIEIDVAPGDSYAQDFAAELIALFTDAGWTTVFGGSRFSVLETTVYGIRVVVHLHIDSDEDQETGAREPSVLQRAFNAAGLDVPVEVYRNVSPGPYRYMGRRDTHIGLQVGNRPPPPK